MRVDNVNLKIITVLYVDNMNVLIMYNFELL